MNTSRNMTHTNTSKGARGTKLMVDRGLDNSSAHKGSNADLKGNLKGSGDDLGHSISGGKVAAGK